MMYEDIHEDYMYEGGKMFGSDDIRGDIAQEIAGDVIEDLKKVFPGVRIEPAGSTMKKGPHETCGDVDITVDSPFNDENADKVSEYANSKFKDAEVNITPVFHMVSFVYPYNEGGEGKRAQVDVKLTDKFDWVQKATYSPSSTESKYKAMAKNLLISVIASTYVMEPPTYFTDEDYKDTKYAGLYTGKIKQKVTAAIDVAEGFFKAFKTCAGKTKMSIRNVTDEFGNKQELPRFEGMKDEAGRPMRQLITTDYEEALKMVFGPEASFETLNTVEKVIDYVFSGKYKCNPENFDEIRKSFIQHMLRQKTNKVDSDAAIRDNEKIDEMVKNFIVDWDSHAGSTPMNESRCSRFGMKINDLVRRMNLL